ncbi:hypothetical protein Trco_006623 [Trichoderma cornu-damae]|uniref:Chromosome transmission fidelity protein 4 n=1 Tax=Trichoderma cornu-damae TaxID=654480 RepID=A0A9P8QFG5_9HYPO|nr:hypothetical protein Trco_006623 [Trichoderma cornu-damae]
MAAPLRNPLTSPAGRSSFPSWSGASVRHITSFGPAHAPAQVAARPLPQGLVEQPPADALLLRRLASVPRKSLSRTCFESSGAVWMGVRGDQPPDPNKAKLGKTLRILQERLPTLLQSPLPQDILAPNISLQLFPSTHPHLPIVSGRVAYNAALWTSPIAWNRVPIIGNVKLEILAERMTSEPLTFLPRRPGAIAEQLVVRWCEKRRVKEDKARPGNGGGGGGGGGISLPSLRLARGVDPNKAFTGLFIFDFDAEGRILTHTIEQAQEGGDWEKGMGAKFVGLTDWLLGGMRDPGDTPIPMFERKRRCDF